MKKRVLFLYALLTCLPVTQGRTPLISNVRIKPCVSGGFIMVHRAGMAHLVQGYPITYEANLVCASKGDRLWQLENNFPDYGLSVQWINFGNPQQLGSGFVAAPFVEIPFSDKDHWYRLHMRLCWGAVYLTRSFQVENNYKNVAIGSRFNAYVQFRWFLDLKVNKSLSLQPGIAFSHASNGRARLPNLGLNLLSVSLAANFAAANKVATPAATVDSSTRRRSRHELLLMAAYGPNQKEVGGEVYHCKMFSAAYQINIRNTHKFSAGVDLFMDDVYVADYKEKKEQDPKGLDATRMSFKLGYAYNVGRVSFPIEAGYYFFQKIHPDAEVVTRLAIRYYSKSGFVFQFGLRTHFAVAYNFEYGIGYRIPLIK